MTYPLIFHQLLTSQNNPAFKDSLRHRDAKRRFEAIHKICKPKLICEADVFPDDDDPNAPKQKDKKLYLHGGCGNVQPVIHKKDGLKLIGTWKHQKSDEDDDVRQEDKRPISPQEALEVFKRISDEQMQVLGLNTEYSRPEWMILTVMPVPPPPVRPGVSVDGTANGMRSEDDLTHKLGDIIRANQNIKKCIEEGSPQHVVTEFQNLLQYHVATFIDNSIAGVPTAIQKSGRPLKTLRSRLKGKEGRLRGNLMGKRVNFSARTVITGDPNLSLDEVGVPESIARTLTYPESVTRYNIDKLYNLVRNGPAKHPGARFIIRENGERLDLRHVKSLDNVQLTYGSIVERHLMTGDYIIFNRQPSLHKESMMGHRVRVMPYSTFRLNLSVTTPYNADFDGDEMNLHVPQNEETRAEVKEICMVPLNIVSPQRNGPLMGIVQDSLVAIYKICRRDVYLTKEQVMNTLLWVPDWDGIIPMPAILFPTPRWTGKQIISMALPAGLNLSLYSDPNPKKDDGVFIHQGELMFGLFNKKNVGVGSGGVIHNVYNEMGWEEALRFFNGAQRITNYWLLHTGFSIGIGDTVPDAKTIEAIQTAITEKKTEVEDITRQATENQLESLPGMNIRETFESKVSKALNDAREVAGTKTSDSLKDINNAVQMSRSGSKGSNINISQMTALVGQQSVEGKRVPFGFSYRTLPHFTKDDYSPESRGFVENSYLRGLTPSEFFFHAMAGREGLIDTAVKTAETGYIQRRLVKALEDVMVKYDGSIRNSLGDIVEFVYGEDGMDGQHIEKQRVDMIMCSDAQFEKMFRVDVTDPKFMISGDLLQLSSTLAGDMNVQNLLDEEYDQLLKDRETFRDAFFTRLDDDGEMFQLPLNVGRTIETAKTKFRIKTGMQSNLHPRDVIKKVRAMLDDLLIVRGTDPLSLEAQHSATMLIKGLLRSRLAFKRLVVEHSINELALDYILGDLKTRFLKTQANPGEMVGVLAAQSIGEPATQMTLNTFHFTGISSKNVTLGVPRLKEILNIAVNIKTPSMLIYQTKDMLHSQEGCKRLRNLVEHTNLRSVTESTEIYYDPDIMDTVIEADKDTVESYFIVPDEGFDMERQSKWMLRIILGRRKLLDKGLTVSEVGTKIKEEYGDDVAVIFSDDNADEQVIRLRLLKDPSKDPRDEDPNFEEDTMLKRLEEHLLKTLTIRGVEGVSKAFIDHRSINRVTEDGSIKKSSDDPLCEEWFLNTSGTSLKQVLQIEGVDPYRTYSNSFMEILNVLGIEAARGALMQELWKVLSFDGSYVNHRHLIILVDVMTSRGYLMAVSRHGINRADTGALMRCSFEETVEILLEAAAVGEIDDCRGISENVMLGQLAPLGTGEMQVFIDEDMLKTAQADSRFGLDPVVDPNSHLMEMTPYYTGSPRPEESSFDMDPNSAFSPIIQAGLNEKDQAFSRESPYTPRVGDSPFDGMTPRPDGMRSPYGGQSPWNPTSPMIGTSPIYAGAMSPGFSLSSPAFNLGSSPSYGSTSPTSGSATSPSFSPSSPTYKSPFNSASPAYSPTSPSFSPTGATSPRSGAYSPAAYSPASPDVRYSPGGDGNGGKPLSRFSPKSPAASYTPTSPNVYNYSPTSPNVSYTPTSPATYPGRRPGDGGSGQGYSPSSPKMPFSPASPAAGGNTSPQYSPSSPAFTPPSPGAGDT
jgi:DNA-directed RNA polymerase II subunit RPB1